MKSQPNRNYDSNDDVQTPPDLARRIVEHFQPGGTVLEPCKGEGRVYGEETVTLDIPAGVQDGMQLSVGGRGNAGERGGAAGDLTARGTVGQGQAVRSRKSTGQEGRHPGSGAGPSYHSPVTCRLSPCVIPEFVGWAPLYSPHDNTRIPPRRDRGEVAVPLG